MGRTVEPDSKVAAAFAPVEAAAEAEVGRSSAEQSCTVAGAVDTVAEPWLVLGAASGAAAAAAAGPDGTAAAVAFALDDTAVADVAAWNSPVAVAVAGLAGTAVAAAW